MDLGEAGAADREVPAGGDEGGQLGGAAEPALGLDEVPLPPRRVAAQREHVLDPGRLDPVQRARQPLRGLADAAEVGHRLAAELVLQRRGDLDRAVAGRAAGAVGDRDEVELEVRQLTRGRVELLGRLRGLRREELDREGRPPRGDDLVDPHPRRVTARLAHGRLAASTRSWK